MQNYDIYICACHEDKAFVDAICQELSGQGINYFTSFDEAGEKDASITAETITNSKLFLFVASKQGYQSAFTGKELVYAFNHIPIEHILVYIVDQSELPDSINFTTKSENVFRILQNEEFFQKELQLVNFELTQKICVLLGRKEKTIKIHFNDLPIFWKVIIALVCWGVAISIGFYFQSFLIGLCTLLSMSFTYGLFISRSILNKRFSYTNNIGKIVLFTRQLIFLLLLLSGPFSIWKGIQDQSWLTGIFWFIGCSLSLPLLNLACNKIPSLIPSKRSPLINLKSSEDVYDYYLCFDRHDDIIVERIITELKRNGITYKTGTSGDVEECVKNCRGFIYVASQNSYRNENCNKELTYGFNHRRPILAYIIDQSVMPEDKQMVFSNSNFRSISTHPIETTLMTDLKQILRNHYGQNSLAEYGNSLYKVLLSLSFIIGIACTILSCYYLESYSLGFVSFICISSTNESLQTVNKLRKKYTKRYGTDIIILDCLLVLIFFLLPIGCWWLLRPGVWMAVLLGFLIIVFVAFFLEEIYAPITVQNPVGKLSPGQIEQYFDVFISYSRKNTAKANQVCDVLQQAGFSYFIDRQGIPGGAEFPTVLADAIKNCGIFLFLQSEDCNNSKFCQQELHFAEQKKSIGDIFVLHLHYKREGAIIVDINNNNDKKKDTPLDINMSEKWENALVYNIKARLPHTENYQSHQLQQGQRSVLGMLVELIKTKFFLHKKKTKQS